MSPLRSLARACLWALVLALPLAPSSSAQRARRVAVPGVWYVRADASAAGNGRSWTTAFRDLQDALHSARAGDEVWVAAGTYTPGGAGASQASTFAIPSGVRLYGGFRGTEGLRSQRDPVRNPTILSGDLNGDDTYSPVFNIGTLNAWNIVTFQNASPSTRLDGFTLLAGHTSGASYPNYLGAGALVLSGSPRIVGCTFDHCVAYYGGALFARSGAAVIERCNFWSCYASSYSGEGGAIFNDGSSSLTVRDSWFVSNTAEARGSQAAGGAIYNESGGTLRVEDSTFWGNTALPPTGAALYVSYGGAVFSFLNASVVLERCRFEGNSSNVGGAVYLWSSTTAQVTSCLFENNRAVKVILSGGFEGGAIAAGLAGGSATTLVGCLFHGGVADSYGGALLASSTVSNSIFWGNYDNTGTIGTAQVKANRVVNCCVENMLVGQPGEDPPDPLKFPGSTAADPMFRDALLGDFHLLSGSPCIDAGDNTAWPAGTALDLDGRPRFLDDPATPDTGVGPAPIGDMGPFEFDPAG